MCQYCLKHSNKVWYLEKDSYDINSGNFMKILPGKVRKWFYDFISSQLDNIVDSQTESIGTENEPYTGLMRWFFNYFAKNIIGGQVVPSFHDALKVIDMGDDFFLHYCSCKRGAGGGDDYRCIFINHNAHRQRKMSTVNKDKGRFIDKDEARNILREHRRKGLFHTVMWGMRPKVSCICNCDHYCAGLYVPEIRWGLLPSIKVSRVKNRDNCEPDCNICLETCYPKAIVKDEKEKIIKVDQTKCIGCHLCIENCPKGVFEFEPRRIYYDVITGKTIERTIPL
ncbi:MAG: hypothetical protein EU541_06355 [Promethearchaeota archaeon]|nr:MAG: hypothetical protein EU541_06355 [Candidatus Lokiarchaeota archaeon]